MNRRLFPLLLLLALAVPARATLIYSLVQNIPIPVDPEGTYLRVDTGATASTLPGDWQTAPWLNPFFGGVGVANSSLLRVVISGSDQLVNVARGTVINGAGNFASGESVSSTHVGSGAGQFQLGVVGIVGFQFQQVAGGPRYFGWLELEIDNASPGRIVDWAYDNTPDLAVAAGIVPEPGTALLCWGGFAVFAMTGGWPRRRKTSRGC